MQNCCGMVDVKIRHFTQKNGANRFQKHALIVLSSGPVCAFRIVSSCQTSCWAGARAALCVFAAARPEAVFYTTLGPLPVRLLAPSYFTRDGSVSFLLQPPFLTKMRPPTTSFAGNSGATVEMLPSSSRSLQLQLSKSSS